MSSKSRFRLRYSLFLFLILFNFAPKTSAQINENTNNRSSGSSSSFTITINSTHGIQSSASKTPDFDVETTGNMVLKNTSSTYQENNNGSGFIRSDANGTIGQSQGVKGFQQVDFDKGTMYSVNIKSKTGIDNPPNIGTASGSSTGSVSTSVTITGSETDFLNTFIRSFNSEL